MYYIVLVKLKCFVLSHHSHNAKEQHRQSLRSGTESSVCVLFEGQFNHEWQWKLWHHDCVLWPYTAIDSLMIKGLNRPYGDHWTLGQSGFCIERQRVQTFGSCDDRPEQLHAYNIIAVDDVDNNECEQWLQVAKFTSSNELIMCVGKRGSKEDELGHVESQYIEIKCIIWLI